MIFLYIYVYIFTLYILQTLKGRTLQEVIDSFQSKLNNANEHKIMKKLTSNDACDLSSVYAISCIRFHFCYFLIL